MKRLLFALLFASTLHAQHDISRIEVLGNVPASIVLPQSAIEEGRRYSDADLAVAVARLRRLPFVFDARYFVDGQTLVLEVTGTTPLFFDVNAFGQRQRSSNDSLGQISGGGRHFLGGGVAEARLVKALTGRGDSRSVDLAYSHYGIGGTRFFATAGGSINFEDDDEVQSDPNLRLTVGYPLTLRQTLTASAHREGFESQRNLFGLQRPLVSSLDRRTVELRWTFDTTDDPYFARSGSLLTAGPSWTREKAQREIGIFVVPPGTPEVFTTLREGTAHALTAEGRKLWPVFTRGAVSAGFLAVSEQVDFDGPVGAGPIREFEGDSEMLRINFGYAHNLFDARAPYDRGRNRIEANFSASRQWFEGFAVDSHSAGLAYVFRKPFGTIRLRTDYIFD